MKESLVQTLRSVFPAPLQPRDTPEEDDSNDHFRTGKVARLPADVRESVNTMLHDGRPYAEIIEKLAVLGHPGFSPVNITRWKKGGYLDWICRRQQLEEIRSCSKANLECLSQLTQGEQASLNKAIELMFANQVLSVLARSDASNVHTDYAIDLISKLGAATARHFRERTRYERLLFLIRQYEDQRSCQNNQSPPKSL